MNSCALVVLSCDKYSVCWKPFFALLNKYWPNHPYTILATETKKCSEHNVISYVNDPCWSARFRKTLEGLNVDYIIVMLDDFFIRRPVDHSRIEYCISQMNDDIAVFNFEKKYRPCDESNLNGFERQFNNQVYLNSCQPSLWNRKALIERLQTDQTPWEWETSKVSDKRLCYINTQDFIIDVGYNHTLDWGISRGKWTPECIEFLKKEGLYDEIISNNSISQNT